MQNLENENIDDEQSVWEYLKYKIRNFSKNVSKEDAHSIKIEFSALETKLKILESKIRYRDDHDNIFIGKKNLENYNNEKQLRLV